MASTSTADFNTTAPKIVKMSELKEKLDKISSPASEDMPPVELAQAVGREFGFSLGSSDTGMSLLMNTVPDKTSGIYRDPASPQDLYVSSKTLAFIFEHAGNPNDPAMNARQDAVNKAISQCQDYTPAKDKLVAVMP